MEAALRTYFAGEVTVAATFLALGLAGLVLGVALLRRATHARSRAFRRGLALPILGVALAQAAVGGAVFLRTDAQVAALSAQLAEAPAQYRAAEGARMRAVVRGFRTLALIEVVLMLVGATLTVVGRAKRRLGLVGAGLGLVVQGGLSLAVDQYAAYSARAYIGALLQFDPAESKHPDLEWAHPTLPPRARTVPVPVPVPVPDASTHRSA
ncbi:MAG: hypothetical protein H6704_25740 [Myxococcales bacterium]|nr:hypothetical protein [Myxococcales bacterium]MCB9539629.1 hypothetical protein [Myxococcales bacterium]